MHPEAEFIIDKLNLIKLVGEGGYYRDTYKSDNHIIVSSCNEDLKDGVYSCSNLGMKSPNIRSVSTLIYYLLDGDQFSAFHKVKYDEIWHFYKGILISICQRTSLNR